MILDIDHIGYSSTNFEDDICLVQSLGFNIRFVQRGIKNQDIKKKLLRSFTMEHHMALCARSCDISIEVVHYPQVGQKRVAQTSFFPLVGNQEAQLLKQISAQDDLKQLNICISDIPKTLNFWKVLGFNAVEQGDDYLAFRFRSILNGNDYFLYAKLTNAAVHKVFLDDIGFTSLALITSSASRERAALEKHNFKVTPIEHVAIGNKNLSIFFSESPDGHIVEFISLEGESFEGKLA
ncbi:MAG: VOC family protein [Candidatus Babeliales bacterium]|jgi:hypothetical protein